MLVFDDICDGEHAKIPDRVKFVLLFDGTWQDARKKSAIYNLSDALKDARTQRKNILPGSGTIWRWGRHLWDGLTGGDSFSIVQHHYEWLTQHVNQINLSNEQVELYIFGFSRGGYQALLFADMILRFGIPKDLSQCSRNVENYRKGLKKCRSTRLPRREVKYGAMIKHVGLIDPVRAWFKSFLYDYCKPLPKYIRGRCALSINEIRYPFKPYLNIGLGIRQEWFWGVHSDVGLAFGDTKTLGTIVLRWIVQPIEKDLEWIYTIPNILYGVTNAIAFIACGRFLNHTPYTWQLMVMGIRRRKMQRRHVTVRAISVVEKRLGIKLSKPFCIPFLPYRWFRCINRRRVHSAFKALNANWGNVKQLLHLVKFL